MKKEVWKDIKGYEGCYQISNLGGVKRMAHTIISKKGYSSFYPERLMVPVLSTKGYWTIKLSLSGKSNRFLIHRLIAIAFIPNPENKPYINHKDGIKTNNDIPNIEWCTAKENQQHAYDTGLKIGVRQKGEDHGSARLTESDIIAIRESGLTSKELSKKYGVTRAHINQILARRRWSHI